MPAVVSGAASTLKPVSCTYCGGRNDVSPRAMSVFCHHCRKRLILEDFKITSYYAVREFYTCGQVVVEKKGQVIAPIRASSLTVRGKVQGRVDIGGPVRIDKTGQFKGEITAPSLHVESGAVVDAQVRIGRSE
jgi:hypothetical protein